MIVDPGTLVVFSLAALAILVVPGPAVLSSLASRQAQALLSRSVRRGGNETAAASRLRFAS